MSRHRIRCRGADADAHAQAVRTRLVRSSPICGSRRPAAGVATRRRSRLATCLAACAASIALAMPAIAMPLDDADTASFALSFHDETSAYRDAVVVMLPGKSVVLTAAGGPPGDYAASSRSGTLVQQGAKHWKWTAPTRPGTFLISIAGPARDVIDLHAFVMVPATQVERGLLNGYRIGEYPRRPASGGARYAPPTGFIEVTRENEDTKVSPHFSLKQFLCKEDTSKTFPKYVVLQERLPITLEAVLERVNELGVRVDTLHLMSAYRTPFYNRAIGDVKYSMHQWGSAADIYVDPSQRDRMVDLNRDGRIDVDDAKYLYDEIERLLAEPEHRRLQGGLGYYPATAAHPPFVHVDVRGTAARWKG
jgi:peptidase M15-like protein